jgi:integrase
MAWEIHKTGVRAKLRPRSEPYWRSLGPNRSIGFRLTEKGSRSWLAKHDKDGEKKQHALADDTETYSYKQAAEAAEKWFKELDQGITSDPTVRKCCEDYLEILRKRNQPGAAYTAGLTFEREVYDKKLANIRMSAVRRKDVQDWVNALKDTTSPANLKRQLTQLQAALNSKVKAGAIGISVRQHWTTLELPKVPNGQRKLFLDLAERRALLEAIGTGGLHDMAEAIALMGARPGVELTQARVEQFDSRKQTMTIKWQKGGQPKTRDVLLTPPALELFKRLSKDKLPKALLFVRDDGTPWPHSSWDTLIKAAAKKANLPPETCMYTLRHSFISQALDGGSTTLDVARICGTSVVMIEKNYGKIITESARERLSKVVML